MRTTVTLDEDVAAEIRRLSRTEGIGISEALNRLARAGAAAPRPASRYRARSAELGLRLSVDDIGAVLELLDES